MTGRGKPARDESEMRGQWVPDYGEPAWLVTEFDLCPTGTWQGTSIKQDDRVGKTYRIMGIHGERQWKGGGNSSD